MPDETNLPAPQGQFLIYADGASQLQVRLEGNTVWLTQKLIAELYGVSVKTVSEHLVNIYAEAELPPEATIRSFRIVQRDGTRDVSRNVEHYSLDAILAVGYRVRSARGTAFRQWATARLAELLVKGFTMDDQRPKDGRTLGSDYFDELLARIRDIRSSERMFYQKITDIYAKFNKFTGEQTGPFPFADFPDHKRLTDCYHRHTGIKLDDPSALLLFQPDSAAYQCHDYQDATIRAALESHPVRGPRRSSACVALTGHRFRQDNHRGESPVATARGRAVAQSRRHRRGSV